MYLYNKAIINVFTYIILYKNTEILISNKLLDRINHNIMSVDVRFLYAFIYYYIFI